MHLYPSPTPTLPKRRLGSVFTASFLTSFPSDSLATGGEFLSVTDSFTHLGLSFTNQKHLSYLPTTETSSDFHRSARMMLPQKIAFDLWFKPMVFMCSYISNFFISFSFFSVKSLHKPGRVVATWWEHACSPFPENCCSRISTTVTFHINEESGYEANKRQELLLFNCRTMQLSTPEG